MASSPKNAENR